MPEGAQRRQGSGLFASKRPAAWHAERTTTFPLAGSIRTLCRVLGGRLAGEHEAPLPQQQILDAFDTPCWTACASCRAAFPQRRLMIPGHWSSRPLPTEHAAISTAAFDALRCRRWRFEIGRAHV